MEKIAIIPARGGSKRLPRKNILPLNGKPMIHYPINAAIKSGLFDDVIVSTEDIEIANIAKIENATVIMRPEGLAKDNATVSQVCSHILKFLKNKNIVPVFFCCIYATAAFIKSIDISEAFKKMNNHPKADFVIGVSDFNLQPHQALKIKDGYLSPVWPNIIKSQSQTQPELVASNGTFYWAKTNAFESTKSFYGKKLKGHYIDKLRAIDIDTADDYRIAKILAPILLK